MENIVQAIARDCLAAAIEHLEAAGFPVVFHIHDEVVIDCRPEQANLDDGRPADDPSYPLGAGPAVERRWLGRRLLQERLKRFETMTRQEREACPEESFDGGYHLWAEEQHRARVAKPLTASSTQSSSSGRTTSSFR